MVRAFIGWKDSFGFRHDGTFWYSACLTATCVIDQHCPSLVFRRDEYPHVYQTGGKRDRCQWTQVVRLQLDSPFVMRGVHCVLQVD